MKSNTERASDALGIVQDVVAVRNAKSLILTMQPTLGLDSLITAVEILAEVVLKLAAERDG